MTNQEKELLISEIKKYNDLNPIIINIKNKKSLYSKLNDNREAKKILIKNEYGLLGNLLYKYRNNLNGDILIFILIRDISILLDIWYFSKESHSYSDVYKFVPNNFKNKKLKNKELILSLVKDYQSTDVIPYIFYFIDNKLKLNIDFMIKIINTNNECIMYIDNKLRKNIDFLIEVLKINLNIITYLTEQDILNIKNYLNNNPNKKLIKLLNNS